MEHYTEPLSASEYSRQIYADSMERAVAHLRRAADEKRAAYVDPARMAAHRERYRREYAELIGIDLCKEVFGDQIPVCEFVPVGEDSLCRIERMKLKIAEETYFTGLLLTPWEHPEKSPVAIMCHGGGGSPELCCDLLGENNYGGVVRRLLERGCMVFAPQMLLWSFAPSLCESAIPAYATPYNRRNTQDQLRQCGTSIAGFEIYCLSQVLNHLLAREDVAPEACGMLGLSYGGFYTLHTMAYDTRIKVGYSAAFFNDRYLYPWYDVVWNGAAEKFLDSEVAGLCAPRPLIVDVGRTDTVFDHKGAEAVFPDTEAFYEGADAKDRLLLHVWDGGHKFCPSSVEYFGDQLLSLLKNSKGEHGSCTTFN